MKKSQVTLTKEKSSALENYFNNSANSSIIRVTVQIYGEMILGRNESTSFEIKSTACDTFSGMMPGLKQAQNDR
jgi:hypothetical protein